jgi:hypothetical protein
LYILEKFGDINYVLFLAIKKYSVNFLCNIRGKRGKYAALGEEGKGHGLKYYQGCAP